MNYRDAWNDVRERSTAALGDLVLFLTSVTVVNGLLDGKNPIAAIKDDASRNFALLSMAFSALFLARLLFSIARRR